MDKIYKPTISQVPASVDLRPIMPPIYNQLQLEDCSGNALAALIHHRYIQDNKEDFSPSRLFIYYNERVLEHDTQQNVGVQIEDGLKSLARHGVCDEKYWPYDETKFATKPSKEAYETAYKNLINSYYSVPADLLKSALTEQFPVAIKIALYDSFYSDAVTKTGIVPMPNTATEKFLGAHFVVVVGYNDDTKQFIVRNSWDVTWGDQGYFYLPYDYMFNPHLAVDFWIIK